MFTIYFKFNIKKKFNKTKTNIKKPKLLNKEN